MVTETRSAIRQDLSSLQENPWMLVPDAIFSAVSNPINVTAVPFKSWIGSFDGGYQPPLAVLISERDGLEKPTLFQEEDRDWGKVINRHRGMAIEQDLLTLKDKVLVSVVAGNPLPDAVFLEYYLQTESLRRGPHRIGSAFFSNLYPILGGIGFKILYGVNSRSNLPFFSKQGFYTTEQLQSEDYQRLLLWRGCHTGQGEGIPTIKFLSEGLEKECVKPEILKS